MSLTLNPDLTAAFTVTYRPKKAHARNLMRVYTALFFVFFLKIFPSELYRKPTIRNNLLIS